ncbi:MAG: hypothetical protein SF029_13585, partial [bacterium]|nr:hypothetical protein [bacterium]
RRTLPRRCRCLQFQPDFGQATRRTQLAVWPPYGSCALPVQNYDTTCKRLVEKIQMMVCRRIIIYHQSVISL